MSYATLDLTIEDGLATVTLNRPDKLNALSPELLGELGDVLERIAAGDQKARCLLITGAGRAFCSGADLSTNAGSPGGDGNGDGNGDFGDTVSRSLRENYHPVFEALAALPMPYVSAVNGVAAGAGMSLAIAADVVIAARSAYFLQAFINIGMMPDSGSTWMLPRLVGRARANAMMMLGERISAETAEEWGLIYRCVDDDALMDEARTIAGKLASGPTVALSCIREAVAATDQNDFASQLELEAELQARAARTTDSIEGITAFLQKRKAKFAGR